MSTFHPGKATWANFYILLELKDLGCLDCMENGRGCSATKYMQLVSLYCAFVWSLLDQAMISTVSALGLVYLHMIFIALSQE